MTSHFDQNLQRNAANFAALSPLGFLERSASIYPERLAIVHGALRQTWAQTYARCRQLAHALQQAGNATQFHTVWNGFGGGGRGVGHGAVQWRRAVLRRIRLVV